MLLAFAHLSHPLPIEFFGYRHSRLHSILHFFFCFFVHASDFFISNVLYISSMFYLSILSCIPSLLFFLLLISTNFFVLPNPKPEDKVINWVLSFLLSP